MLAYINNKLSIYTTCTHQGRRVEFFLGGAEIKKKKLKKTIF